MDNEVKKGTEGEVVTIQRWVDLTAAEARERSTEMAERVTELRGVQGAKKATAADYAAQEKTLNARIDHLSTIVKEGKEPRDIEYVWRRNDVLARLELTGPDGDVVESRPLSRSERQGKLAAVEALDEKRKKSGGGGKGSGGGDN